MNADEFTASLKPALTRRGPSRANDVTLAKTIRAELVQAVKAGVLPEGTKFSVRTASARAHSSLTVEVMEWHGGAVFCDAYEAHLLDPSTPWDPGYRIGRCVDSRYSQALNEALALIETIANRHNYDNSDIQTDYFDVGYYLTVSADTVADLAEHGIKMETDPAFAALVARASEAAKALGPKVTKSVCGGSLATCGQWSLERLIKMATKADGRELTYDRRRGWVPSSEGAPS